MGTITEVNSIHVNTNKPLDDKQWAATLAAACANVIKEERYPGLMVYIADDGQNHGGRHYIWGEDLSDAGLRMATWEEIQIAFENTPLPPYVLNVQDFPIGARVIISYADPIPADGSWLERNGAFISDDEKYRELIEFLGGRTLPSETSAAGRVLIKACHLSITTTKATQPFEVRGEFAEDEARVVAAMNTLLAHMGAASTSLNFTTNVTLGNPFELSDNTFDLQNKLAKLKEDFVKVLKAKNMSATMTNTIAELVGMVGMINAAINDTTGKVNPERAIGSVVYSPTAPNPTWQELKYTPLHSVVDGSLISETDYPAFFNHLYARNATTTARGRFPTCGLPPFVRAFGYVSNNTVTQENMNTATSFGVGRIYAMKRVIETGVESVLSADLNAAWNLLGDNATDFNIPNVQLDLSTEIAVFHYKSTLPRRFSQVYIMRATISTAFSRPETVTVKLKNPATGNWDTVFSDSSYDTNQRLIYETSGVAKEYMANFNCPFESADCRIEFSGRTSGTSKGSGYEIGLTSIWPMHAQEYAIPDNLFRNAPKAWVKTEYGANDAEVMKSKATWKSSAPVSKGDIVHITQAGSANSDWQALTGTASTGHLPDFSGSKMDGIVYKGWYILGAASTATAPNNFCVYLFDKQNPTVASAHKRLRPKSGSEQSAGGALAKFFVVNNNLYFLTGGGATAGTNLHHLYILDEVALTNEDYDCWTLVKTWPTILPSLAGYKGQHWVKESSDDIYHFFGNTESSTYPLKHLKLDMSDPDPTNWTLENIAWQQTLESEVPTADCFFSYKGIVYYMGCYYTTAKKWRIFQVDLEGNLQLLKEQTIDSRFTTYNVGLGVNGVPTINGDTMLYACNAYGGTSFEYDYLLPNTNGTLEYRTFIGTFDFITMAWKELNLPKMRWNDVVESVADSHTKTPASRQCNLLEFDGDIFLQTNTATQYYWKLNLSKPAMEYMGYKEHGVIPLALVGALSGVVDLPDLKIYFGATTNHCYAPLAKKAYNYNDVAKNGAITAAYSTGIALHGAVEGNVIEYTRLADFPVTQRIDVQPTISGLEAKQVVTNREVRSAINAPLT